MANPWPTNFVYSQTFVRLVEKNYNLHCICFVHLSPCSYPQMTSVQVFAECHLEHPICFLKSGSVCSHLFSFPLLHCGMKGTCLMRGYKLPLFYCTLPSESLDIPMTFNHSWYMVDQAVHVRCNALLQVAIVVF